MSSSSSYFHKFLRLEYKSLVILFISILALLFLDTPSYLIKASVITGALQMFLILSLGQIARRFAHRRFTFIKALSVLLSPQPQRSIGALVIGIISYTLLVFFTLGEQWSVYELTSITAAFAASTAFLLILARVTGYRYGHFRSGYRLNNEQMEIFVGTLIGTVFLGAASVPLSGFKNNSLNFGAILLPLLMGLGSLCTTYVCALLLETGWSKRRAGLHLISGIASLVLLLLAAQLIPSLLPASWIKHGQAYTNHDLLLITQLGVLSGWLAGKLVEGYKLLARRYVDYVLYRPFKGILLNLLLRLLINGLVATLPMALVMVVLLFAFNNTGLFGVAMALLGMVSNVGVGLVIDTNRLLAENIGHISGSARRKLELVSPSFARLFAENVKKESGLVNR